METRNLKRKQINKVANAYILWLGLPSAAKWTSSPITNKIGQDFYEFKLGLFGVVNWWICS